MSAEYLAVYLAFVACFVQRYGKIEDVVDWFSHLMLGAEVLSLKASQQLLDFKQGALAKQQRQRKAELEAAAQEEAR